MPLIMHNFFQLQMKCHFLKLRRVKKEMYLQHKLVFNTTVQDTNNLKIIDNQIRISNIDDPFEILSFAKNINNLETEKSIDKLSRIKTICNDDYKYVKEQEKQSK